MFFFFSENFARFSGKEIRPEDLVEEEEETDFEELPDPMAPLNRLYKF